MSDNHGHHEQNLFHKKVEHTEEKTAFPSAITKKDVHFRDVFRFWLYAVTALEGIPESESQ